MIRFQDDGSYTAATQRHVTAISYEEGLLYLGSRRVQQYDRRGTNSRQDFLGYVEHNRAAFALENQLRLVDTGRRPRIERNRYGTPGLLAGLQARVHGDLRQQLPARGAQ